LEDETLVVCECQFKNSKLDGAARLMFSDGTLWKGFYVDDKRHGISD